MKEENQAIIKALNMYGRVPKTWELLEEIERLNTKEEQLIRRLEDLIIVGEQVENEWAIDICKMIIEELKGSDKE